VFENDGPQPQSRNLQSPGLVALFAAAATFLHLSTGYIVRAMRALRFMEDLLAIEAERKFLLAASDRSYEQTLMQELLRIFKEVESRSWASFERGSNPKADAVMRARLDSSG
jgi:hypothetical protein